ncbi:hypothetical protein F8M41_017715 [Gigaspora margarita]|uniref:Nuclear transport factor 2 domain-containing protein n=1 Tax=Gigaspora margarita TaxID=4874 RepID=A0A8H4AMV2_GIGMA|nr:hypothetical protein F8M41_017715 [Gigaspora margarita]
MGLIKYHCNNTNIFETEPSVIDENDQLLKDYYSLFNEDNVENLSQLIDDSVLNEETNLSTFNEINFELEKLNFQKLKNSFEKYQNSIPSSKKVVTFLQTQLHGCQKQLSKFYKITLAVNAKNRAKVGHKADMKGSLKNTSCKLEALYGEVSGGLGPFGLEISFYAMSWFEGIYLFRRIDSCTIPSEENNCYLFEEIYCILTELESKLKKAEEIVIKLHSANIINKRRLITNENSSNLNMNRTPLSKV